MVILGIGNVLQKDDGLGVYAATYLSDNYTFLDDVKIVNGGVQGIHLLNLLTENDHILILDSIGLDDKPASIYAIPAHEISGYGLNNGGAHEIGIIQCLDMMELQGKPVPKAMVLGIVPHEVTFDMSLSDVMMEAFDDYISVVLQYLDKQGISYKANEQIIPLKEIVNQVVNDPARGVSTS